jgi:arylsulfatase A-like enzyme
MLAESSAPARRKISIVRWVFLSVLIVQLLTFMGGLALLIGVAGTMDNKFRDEALDQFWGYLTWVNVEVFLKGYLLSGLVLGIIALPVVRWLLRKRDAVSRWAVFWRTGMTCTLITLFLALRLPYLRPHLLDSVHPDHWLFRLRDMIPSVVRDTAFPALAEVLPWIGLAGIVWYYLNSLLRLCAPAWPAGARRVTVLAKIGVIGAACWAIPAWNGRASHVPRADKRPNVLILASDSLRADHLSCNGYRRVTSPAIDELAAKSVNFTKCFTPIASTLESLTSMMSGQYPHTHGMQHMFPNKEQVEKVLQDSPALAQLMRDRGYDTAVMGDWCAGVFDMLPMGFEKVDATTFDNFKLYMSQAIYLAHPVVPLYFDNPVGYWLFPKLESSAFFVTPDVVTDRVIERLAKQSRSEKPFFLKVFYSCTHIPYTNAPEYAKKFTDPAYNGEHKHQFKFDVDKWIGSIDMGETWRATKKADVEQIIGLYDGGVAKFDDCVRRVIGQLKATGQFENTIILVTSDHGDDLFEPNCTFGHGISFNGGDQNNNIPAVLYVPGMERKARSVSKIVRTLDFAPTILDLCGIPADRRMEGVSLRPYVEDSNSDLGLAFFGETSYLFCKRYIPGEKPLYLPPMDSTTFIDESFNCHFVLKDKYQPKVLETKERVLRTERWKLVFTPAEGAFNILRLYDLQNDPHCERNVALLYPEVFDAMEQRLMSWMRKREETRVPEIFPPFLFPQGEPPAKRPAA